MPRIAGINQPGDSPVGEITAFGGTVAPTGWLMCNGAVLLRADYPELFAVIGTSCGAPSGTEFRLPELRGRFLRGANGDATGFDPGARAAMFAGGNAGFAVGSVQDDAFQGHAHSISNAPNNNMGSILNQFNQFVAAGPLTTYQKITDPVTGGYGTVRLSTETRSKNAAVNYIIKYV